jgi:phage repressor protein C with HTH and peptisase S24 domain
MALLPERRASEIENYQAAKKNVLKNLKKTVFQSAAFDSADEKRVAILLEGAKDIVGWVYNHRSGVGYSIPYDWQGYTAQYYPDFIARAEFEGTPHNFIIEVKGRIDDRDKAKARRGQRYSELLTEHDREPWHYLLLLENKSEGRRDISAWEEASSTKIVHVLRRHESLPLYPEAGSQPLPSLTYSVQPEPRAEDKFETRLPVYELAVAAGTFGDSQIPEPAGWMQVRLSRRLDQRMFVAKVAGRSMEAGIPDGSWGVFRMFQVPPTATALDGRRVVVQLRDETDPETGGRYTLKRWKVLKFAEDGSADEIELRPDNPAYSATRYTAANEEELRPVAEFLELVK